MRAQTPLALLADEARRKPLVKALLDRAAELDDAAIAAAPVLPWVKQALQTARQAGQSATPPAALLAWVDAATTTGQVADPMGELWRWHGPDTFIALDRGALELRHGQLFWLPQTGGVWIETVFARRIDPRLTGAGRREASVSKSQYTARYRAETNRLLVPVHDPVAQRHQVLQHYGVRFGRPGK